MSFIKSKLAYIKWYYKIKRKFSYRKKAESVVIMMATPTHGNLGDQAIVYAQRRILEQAFSNKKIIEIPNNYYVAYPQIVKKFICKQDVLIIDGGGNLGTLWPKEDDKITNIINNFAQNKIIVFPQTCFYQDVLKNSERIERNKKAYLGAKDLTVMLRDKASFDLFNKLFSGVKSLFVPDVVLSLKPKTIKEKRQDVLVCFRQDCEKKLNETQIASVYKLFGNKNVKNFSTLVEYNVKEENREKELYKKWAELSSAKLLICDRLHAMIFALITKTPCIAIDNVSKKVGGSFEWIKNAPYVRHVQDVSQIENVLLGLDLEKEYQNRFEYPIQIVMEQLK